MGERGEEREGERGLGWRQRKRRKRRERRRKRRKNFPLHQRSRPHHSPHLQTAAH
jgi:hypothetical protein